ncbi:hypothetical protein C8Q75DRAFT_801274 [Abortiporus biennis]|nr:hypothetical protein C8Q75DRAFT_801274 [Abortiporus biennis]
MSNTFPHVCFDFGLGTCDNQSSSSTFGQLGVFSRIFVLSLPNREDRRTDMDRLFNALSLNWTYVNSTTAESQNIQTIMEEVRWKRRMGHEEPQHEFSWNFDDKEAIDGIQDTGLDVVPSNSVARSRRQSRINQELNFTHSTLEPLTCATGNHTTGPLFDVSLPSYMILSAPKIACWYSHLKVIETIAFDGHTPGNNAIQDNSVSLVLEDDIDMELDIEERLRSLWHLLPDGWDMVYLGHCWSDESRFPALSDSSSRSSSLFGLHDGLPKLVAPHQNMLHPSFAPKCTHAYALNRRGARRLMRHLLHPSFAYSRALDQALAWLIESGRIKSYSIVPSVVAQRKIASSDVDGGEFGTGSRWREVLEHGVLEAS